MRLSARVQKLEDAEPRCDPNRFRLAPEGHVPSDADRCHRCGGCHVLVIEEEIVEAVEPLENGPEVRS
ncbi:hypothetical protein VT84_12535 [Gemmata sp. SH-PL17]|uniref:hypothetical protein n=1 Tax=Gemmata sp. SH-PL17 TaxID=1630693 RepID=UPI00078C6BE6|nr:hypothetical protein [Gemmata sp. SH-PL17]AMV25218.1 hypothetical protein VT84_12535 [Gemmata sp. SH-PL17]